MIYGELFSRIIQLSKDEFLLYEGKVDHHQRQEAVVRWRKIADEVFELEKQVEWFKRMAVYRESGHYWKCHLCSARWDGMGSQPAEHSAACPMRRYPEKYGYKK